MNFVPAEQPERYSSALIKSTRQDFGVGAGSRTIGIKPFAGENHPQPTGRNVFSERNSLIEPSLSLVEPRQARNGAEAFPISKQMTMDERPSVGRVSQAFRENGSTKNQAALSSKREVNHYSSSPKQPQFRHRLSIASQSSYFSVASFKSHSSNAPTSQFPLQRLPSSRLTQVELSDEKVARRNKMNWYAIGILVLAVLAAFLYPLRRSTPQK